MPALAGKTYFNYGGQGPLPAPSLDAIVSSWREIQELGPFTEAVWPHISGTTGTLRNRLAAWCGVGQQRLALTENVTTGCTLPLWGLPWQPGDELLISDCEHPGVVASCQELARREQLTPTSLPLHSLCCGTGESERDGSVLDALEQSLTPRTRLVVLSHLLWNTGAVMPIAQVAGRLANHPRRPWLLVDAAQSMGSLPLGDAAEASDIYAFTGHKWCCGPEGLGGVALSERLLEQGSPTLIGWRTLSRESDAASGFHHDARRFEVATSCTPLQAGLNTSLQLLEAEGSAASRLETIRRRSRQLWLGMQEISGLRTLLPEPPPAGLVSFVLEGRGETAEVVARLGAQGLWIRSLSGPPCLRACTHITTTEEEVELLLGALTSLPRR